MQFHLKQILEQYDADSEGLHLFINTFDLPVKDLSIEERENRRKYLDLLFKVIDSELTKLGQTKSNYTRSHNAFAKSSREIIEMKMKGLNIKSSECLPYEILYLLVIIIIILVTVIIYK